MKPETHFLHQVAIPETHDRTIFVKVVPFRLALQSLGADPDTNRTAAGELLGGMEGKSVTRALNGGAVGSPFQAQALALFEANAAKLAAKGLSTTWETYFEHRAREAQNLVAAR